MKRLSLISAFLFAACSGDTDIPPGPDTGIPAYDATVLMTDGMSAPDAGLLDSVSAPDAHPYPTCVAVSLCHPEDGPGMNPVCCGGLCVRPGECCCTIEGVDTCGPECAD
jgi:hypothetical protein